MKVVDIRVDHFFAIVINAEKAYRDERHVLESVNDFLNTHLVEAKGLGLSDREQLQHLFQSCQRTYNDLGRIFNAKNIQFVQRINDLLEKKLALFYKSLPDDQLLQETKNLHIVATQLLDDLKEWTDQLFPLPELKAIFGKNRFLNEQLYVEWQNRIEQVKNEIYQIRYHLLSSFESVGKTDAPENVVPLVTKADQSAAVADKLNENDWLSFLGDHQPVLKEKSNASADLSGQTTKDQPNYLGQNSFKDASPMPAFREGFGKKNSFSQSTPKFDLLKAFARLKEENELLNQTYLRQNDAIEKMRKLFEDRMREIVDENTLVRQQQQAESQKRVDELVTENSSLKQKLADLEDSGVEAARISQEELDRSWKLLLDDLSASEPTETNLYQSLCDELTAKNKEISDLTAQVSQLKQQNIRLKNAWLKTSRLICNEIVELLNAFKTFSDQVKQCATGDGSDGMLVNSRKWSANCLRAFIMIRRSVELLKRIYLQNLLGQVQ